MPASPRFRWSHQVDSDGIGGLAATTSRVLVTGRDTLDRLDVIQCLDAGTGKEIWRHSYVAEGNLDYGNSPRATPLVHNDHVFTLGAFGHLCCLELETGFVAWQRNLAGEFAAADLVWGHSGSPLIADGKLIVQPGGADASLVALDPETGDTIWSSSGRAASYSSFMPVEIDGVTQLVGLDSHSLGGWNPENGERLWSIIPPHGGDFNVATPLITGQRIIVTSENNGTRLYEFGGRGMIHTEPLAVSEELAPDTHTPVIVSGWVIGGWNGLVGLKLDDNFSTTTRIDEDSLNGYSSMIAGPDRVLALTESGLLLLIAVDDDSLSITARLKLARENPYVLAHPALVNEALYLRIGNGIHRLDLPK
ncbi:MAG: PQQ-binding-like beta-propeller repeat protein [Pirellulaceae bacterium]